MSRLVPVFLLLALISTIGFAASPELPASTANVSKLPISFVPNSGQASAEYQYVVAPQQASIKFRPDGVDFEVMNSSGKPVLFPFDFGNSAALEAKAPQAGKVNYLLGRDSTRWRRNLPTFGKLHYRDVYRGIDLDFYGNSGVLEHDFVVAPGADPSQIKMNFPASHKLAISPQGDAVLSSNGAVLKFKPPLAYQETPQGRVVVPASFKRKGHSLAFAIGNYRKDLPLVIDPAVVFSTYIADASAPTVGVATDTNGNTYVLGYTGSTNYPVLGGIQQTCNACGGYGIDVVITKLNATGTGLVFSTYLGGSQQDMPAGIQVDSSGNVIIAGRTDSADFPVKNPLASGTPSYAQSLGFITSLAADGASLNYSTLLGQTPSTNITAMNIGSDGSAYVTGVTDDQNFPATPGAISTVTPGYPKSVVFLTKISSSGTLAYSGFVGDASPQNGGGGLIGAVAVAVDAQGAAYLHGNAGLLWPTTAGAYQTSIPGSSPYAAPFVTKVSADGSHLEYSTFLGPDAGTAPAAITVNSTGEAWVAGSYAGAGFPITSDAYSHNLTSSSAPYLSKLSADGTAVIYSTYVFGGTTVAYPTAVQLDGAGHVWIAGHTVDHAMPLLNPLQSNFDQSGHSGYIVEFDASGKTLLFSTYLGAQSYSQITGLAIDPSNKVHVAGWGGQDVYTTSGAYRASVTPPPPNYQYLYPFAAVIDPNTDSGSICVEGQLNGNVSFFTTLVGTTSTNTIVVDNCGKADLPSLSFSLSDPQLSIPSATNNCVGALAAGSSCSLALAYTPSSESDLNAKLVITSTGNVVPRVVVVGGRGATPHVYTYGNSISFDPLLIGTSVKTYTYLRSTGYVPLHIDMSGITTSGDYAVSYTNCASTLNPGISCILEVTFQPTAAGPRPGVLKIPTDDPANLLVSIALNGTGVATYPVPLIDHIEYATAPVGSNITVQVAGSGFFPESSVVLGGAAQTTQYTSNSLLAADINPASLANMGELNVTVTNPLPGGGTSNSRVLTVYKLVPGSYQAMVYSQSSGKLYVTVPASASSDPNTILVIDPTTGEVQDKIVTGGNPNAIALSSDEQYLFVGLDSDHTVVRINVASRVVEKTFDLPIDATFGGKETVLQIIAVPGAPESFVVALNAVRSPSSDGVALFDDTGMVNHLPYDFPNWLEVSSIAFASDTHTLYATPFESYGSGFFKVITLDATGLHYTKPSGGYVGSIGSGYVTSDGTLLYSTAGEVFDPATQTKITRFATPSTSFGPLTIDRSSHRIFGLDFVSNVLTSFDSDYSKVGTLTFDSAFVGSFPRSLVRWGTDGLAWLPDTDLANSSSSNLLLLRSSLVNGHVEAVPLTMASITPAQVAAGSSSLTIVVRGTGFTPSTVVKWNGSTIPATYSSGTGMAVPVSASLLATVGTSTLSLTNPGGATVSTTFTVFGVPNLTYSPTSLDFGTVPVNTASPSKTITIQNSGSAPLTGVQLAVAGDFTMDNHCASTLAEGASCSVALTFAPKTGGHIAGTLTIASDATDVAQTVALTGTSSDFRLDGGSSTPSSTVNAGTSANYQLAVASDGGFTGQVALACTGAPQYATCTVTPNSLSITGSSPAAVSVTVTTSQTVTASILKSHPSLFTLACISIGTFFLVPIRRRKQLGTTLSLLVLMVGVVAGTVGVSSCGGGASAGSTPPPSPVTHYVASGTYTLQVSATSGSTTKTTNLTLVVR